MVAETQQTQQIPGTELDTKGAPLNVVNKLFIDIYGYTTLNDLENGNWARLATKIQTITPSANETTNNNSYYDGEGFGSTEVTGKRYQLACSGQRYVGNPAQDYIASKQFAIGQALHCRVIWVQNGQAIVSEATLTNIVATGGEASANQTFSCTIEFNGKPRTVNGQLTLTENRPDENHPDQLWTYKAHVDPDAKPSATTTPATPQSAQPRPIIPVKVISANDADDTDKKTDQDSGRTPGVAAGGTGIQPKVGN